MKASDRQEAHYAARNNLEWQRHLIVLDNNRRRVQQKKSVTQEPEKESPKIDSVPMAGGTKPVPLSPEQEKFKKMMDLLERE